MSIAIQVNFQQVQYFYNQIHLRMIYQTAHYFLLFCGYLFLGKNLY